MDKSGTENHLISLFAALEDMGLISESEMILDILVKSAKEDKVKKDKCYYKVKSRYKKWPSAYASGALVKCREVGAANWGEGGSKKKKKKKNSKKKKK